MLPHAFKLLLDIKAFARLASNRICYRVLQVFLSRLWHHALLIVLVDLGCRKAWNRLILTVTVEVNHLLAVGQCLFNLIWSKLSAACFVGDFGHLVIL